ncbi:hypothetical protein [Fulvimonas yonginensis]|uniref:Lipoprotein n=1 Tax=Fulvimonas yonginensis TaxID=1495200 RepID=A0ABU8JBX6_9GAMM
MRTAALIECSALAVAALFAVGAAQARHPKTMTDAQMIASAMRAAPPSVARHATIMAMDANGKMRTLRQGSNGFTCIPDAPATPGPDPMCADKAAMGWVNAWLNHTTPPAGTVGFMYMLEGGTDASNTDPYATKPKGEHWIKTGPHVMVVGADSAFYDQYPKNADPDTGAPYVMWAGTPYQHLMVPVR